MTKYLSNFNKILAITKLNIDKLKNVLKFVKHSQVFVEMALNWGKLVKINLRFHFFRFNFF